MIYNHNCDKCQFLCTFKEKYDLYYCIFPQYGASLIARYGNGVEDYYQGFLTGFDNVRNLNHPLGEAYRLAKTKKLFLMPCGGLAQDEEPIIDPRECSKYQKLYPNAER